MIAKIGTLEHKVKYSAILEKWQRKNNNTVTKWQNNEDEMNAGLQ
jgi:hypothetical protein